MKISMGNCFGRRVAQVMATTFFLFLPVFLHATIDPTTRADVRWTVWHEGCRVFGPAPVSNPFSDGMNQIGSIRACANRMQQHNQGAQDRIASLNDDQLKSILLDGERDIPAEFQLGAQFDWVCHHEGKLNDFRIWASQGNFESIRGVYHDKQNHNPNARNLLNAVTNQDIKTLLDSIH